MIVPGFPGLTTVTPDFPTSFVSYSHGYLVGNGTSVTVPRPADLVAGDLMIAFMQDNIGGSTMNGAPGWTKFYDAPGLGNFFMCRKIATGSEGSSYSFPITSGTEPSRACLVMIALYHGPTVVNVFSVNAGGSGTVRTALSVTPSLNGTLIAMYTGGQFAPVGPPVMNLEVSLGEPAVSRGFYLFDKYPQGTGATGDKVATFPGTVSGANVLMQIA
jgi:hypothetical protein